MATDFDPYRILEVDSSAGQDQIDEAYRRLWAAYPRDAAPEARLREIQAAYRVLSDPAERRSYDERRASTPSVPTAVAEASPVVSEQFMSRAAARIAELREQGYKVTDQTEASVTLIKKHRRSVFWTIFWFVWGLLPFLVYLYLRRGRSRYLWIGEDGDVHEAIVRPGGSDAAWSILDIASAIGVIIGIVVLSSVPIYLLANEIAGGADQVDNDPAALAVVLIVSALFQFAALGSAWWFGVRKYKLDFRALGLRSPERGWPWLPFTLVAGAMGMVVFYSLALAAVGIEPDTDLPDAIYDNALPLAIALGLTVIMAPFVEEIFFRGFVFGGLARRFGWVWGALGSGTLFGVAHIANAGYLYVLPPIIAIGILFAWGYKYSRSLYPSIAAHFLFNLIQMIGVLATR